MWDNPCTCLCSIKYSLVGFDVGFSPFMGSYRRVWLHHRCDLEGSDSRPEQFCLWLRWDQCRDCWTGTRSSSPWIACCGWLICFRWGTYGHGVNNRGSIRRLASIRPRIHYLLVLLVRARWSLSSQNACSRTPRKEWSSIVGFWRSRSPWWRIICLIASTGYHLGWRSSHRRYSYFWGNPR